MILTELIGSFCIIAFVAFLVASHFMFFTIGRDSGYKAAMKDVKEKEDA